VAEAVGEPAGRGGNDGQKGRVGQRRGAGLEHGVAPDRGGEDDVAEDQREEGRGDAETFVGLVVSTIEGALIRASAAGSTESLDSAIGGLEQALDSLLGVMTRWTTRVEEGMGPLPQRLLVLQSTGKGRGQMALHESEVELVDAGANEFATRLPVREGDHLGLSGLGETFVCSTGLSRVFEGLAPAIGEIRDFEFREGIGMPVTAIVEPDRDRDGHGDETQDKCPQSAAFHLQACSPVALAVDAKARRRSIMIHVRADLEVSVQIFGQVGWGFKSKWKSSGGHSKPTLATDSEGALAERRVTVRLRGQDTVGT
jgi:hypothetical protein